MNVNRVGDFQVRSSYYDQIYFVLRLSIFQYIQNVEHEINLLECLMIVALPYYST